MITIRRAETAPQAQGDPAYFTGSVKVETLWEAPSPARVRVVRVSFEPGARTHWHAHPLGQILIVLKGIGWVQETGQPPVEIREGDVVWIPPEVRHWHGATAHTPMVHLAIQEALDGQTAVWMEEVTDAEYPMP